MQVTKSLSSSHPSSIQHRSLPVRLQAHSDMNSIMLSLARVPEIAISPAPPEEPLVEPFSPFSAASPSTPTDPDSFRPSLLSPPSTMSPRFPRQLSPLRPSDSPVTGQGLERERFEELLRTSRERNAALGGGKRSPDLRKEIAIKVHKGKQSEYLVLHPCDCLTDLQIFALVERRALFLSKVQAPPSPRATLLPKTPPESPAIFHYSLPIRAGHSVAALDSFGIFV